MKKWFYSYNIDLTNKLISSRKIILIISSLYLLGCNKINQNHNFIPIEYQYPKEKIGKGKLFFYEKTGSNRQDYLTSICLINQNENQFLIYSNYAYGYIIDSLKKSVDGKLLEKYDFDLYHNINIRMLKAEILEDKIIDDGTKYGKRNSKFRYKFLNKEINMNEEEKYLYDTIVDNNGLKLKCFVSETKSTIVYKSQGKRISEEVVKTKSYFGKSLGLFCYSIARKDDSSMWFLMRVDDKK